MSYLKCFKTVILVASIMYLGGLPYNGQSKSYGPGMYKVPADLPAGEYLLVATDEAYFQITKDSKNDVDSILANDNFTNRSIVTVRAGQYLTVVNARIIPYSQAPKAQPVGGRLQEGMYKVGIDLPAGEYKVIANGDGYFEVARDSTHGMNSTVANDNFQGSRYVTVSKGQYLKLVSASLVLK
jgi:hypothetical protein